MRCARNNKIIIIEKDKALLKRHDDTRASRSYSEQGHRRAPKS